MGKREGGKVKVDFSALAALYSPTTAITPSTHQSSRERCKTFDIIKHRRSSGRVIKVFTKEDGIKNVHSCQEKIFKEFYYNHFSKNSTFSFDNHVNLCYFLRHKYF